MIGCNRRGSRLEIDWANFDEKRDMSGMSSLSTNMQLAAYPSLH